MTQLLDVIELSKLLCNKPIHGKLAYATLDNFAGQILTGYHPQALDVCLMTPKAANALCQAQNQLIHAHSLGLFIYDSYRPKRAVKHLLQWMKEPVKDEWELTQKSKHYPQVEKSQFVALHYLAEDSGHCYGNTVDVVLYDYESEKILDMGTIYDFMGEKSHLSATAEDIGATAYQNREILQATMKQHGFLPHHTEYWHFSHGGREGREVSEGFDLEITPDLKGLGVR
jgi:D-alanyl-D-alanine dipeptidase